MKMKQGSSSRIYSLTLLAAALAGSVVLTAAEPAHADNCKCSGDPPPKLLPAELDNALGVVKAAMGPFQVAGSIQSVLKLLNIIGDGPNLVAKLDQVQSRLLSEIQYWEDVNLNAATTAAFDKYKAILRNPDQTTSNRERILFLTGASSSNDASDVFAELERLVTDNRDLEKGLELSVSLNTLNSMIADAMVWHDRYFPEEAAYNWWDFDAQLGRAYRAGYHLIKASKVQCHPGYNPGLTGVVREHSSVYETSPLYLFRNNRNLPVGTFRCSFTNQTFTYNPITGALKGTLCPGRGNTFIQSSIIIGGITYKDFSSATLAAARSYGYSHAVSEFRTDKAVSTLRESMNQLRKASGGDELHGEGDLNASQFFDPWVDELEVCGPNNPWAYVANL
jgi:hypothetical protein